ncbi:unnamed protein product [Hyaloperonospora brassicae]|uniref:Phosphoribosyl-AMP cyclohydrolase domain-containing protein n=1 Tax=Hyaloperonospora brassicae TaxID=162125 RepID=A0AAV0UVA1_HYABA|nr:unnamed protein product [Hyaloperonospora brassicae]
MLIPALSFRSLSSVTDATDALLRRLSTLGLVYASLPHQLLLEGAPLAPPDRNAVHSKALKTTVLATRTLLGPFSLEMVDAMVSWLDQGLSQVLMDAASSEDAELERVAVAVSELPVARVVLRVPLASLRTETVAHVAAKIERLSRVASGVVLALDAATWTLERDGIDALVACLQTLRTSVEDTFLLAVEVSTGLLAAGSAEKTLATIQRLHHCNVHVVAPGYCHGEAEETKDVVETTGGAVVDAALAFVACLRTDRPDGLFATVVADEAGVALGLVYSSAESIVAAVSSGRGVYYSRSRGGLWKKGESSGHTQQLIRIDVDCDSDALRFTVRQTGAGFCHLNTRSCWGHDRGLRALESMLCSRHEHAPPGSYTKRLFDDTELLRNKLVEEAQELAEAESISDVAGEAADLMYFAMVRCVAAGCKLSDVEKMLDKRALKVKRRPGNSKAHRIAAANEILHGKALPDDDSSSATSAKSDQS